MIEVSFNISYKLYMNYASFSIKSAQQRWILASDNPHDIFSSALINTSSLCMIKEQKRIRM